METSNGLEPSISITTTWNELQLLKIKYIFNPKLIKMHYYMVKFEEENIVMFSCEEAFKDYRRRVMVPLHNGRGL